MSLVLDFGSASLGFIITAGAYNIISCHLQAFTLQLGISWTPVAVAFIDPSTVIHIQVSLVQWLVHLTWT